jgi:hypothetical protein
VRARLAAGYDPIEPAEVDLVGWRRNRLDRTECGEIADRILGSNSISRAAAVDAL